MKSAMNWALEYDKTFGELNDSADETVGDGVVPFVDIHEIIIRRIQLDAMKEGMRRAADILHVDGDVYIFKYVNEIREERKEAILTAAEQLTEKDL
jgi:hypothetical protein